MTIEKQDGNSSTLWIGPNTTNTKGNPATVFYGQEPNSFSDFGGDVSIVQRSIIGKRKKQRGTITGVTAKAGWATDLTPRNMTRWLKDFFMNDVIATFTNHPVDALPTGAPNILITAVATADDSYAAAAGLLPLKKKMLVVASGFTNAGNNGFKTVKADALTGKVTVEENLTDEAAPPATSKLQVVGFVGAADDLVADGSAADWRVSSTLLDFTTLSLTVGAWYFVGDDDDANSFSDVGFARLSSVAANLLIFDKTTFDAFDDAGTGKTVRFYAPTAIMQDGAVAKEFYNTIYRELGQDTVGTQSEAVYDAIGNDFTMHVPKKEKVTLDVAYLALDHETRNGTDGVLGVAHQSALGESPFNTSSDLYRFQIAAVDPTTLNPTGYFAYANSCDFKITNNNAPNDALGKVNGFSYSIGDFEVNCTVDAYFTTVAAIDAVRQVKLVTLDMLITSDNAGFYFDVPLIELSGGMPKVEKNKPISLPLTTAGVESANGYVAQMGFYAYLPDIAMAANAA